MRAPGLWSAIDHQVKVCSFVRNRFDPIPRYTVRKHNSDAWSPGFTVTLAGPRSGMPRRKAGEGGPTGVGSQRRSERSRLKAAGRLKRKCGRYQRGPPGNPGACCSRWRRYRNLRFHARVLPSGQHNWSLQVAPQNRPSLSTALAMIRLFDALENIPSRVLPMGRPHTHGGSNSSTRGVSGLSAQDAAPRLCYQGRLLRPSIFAV